MRIKKDNLSRTLIRSHGGGRKNRRQQFRVTAMSQSRLESSARAEGLLPHIWARPLKIVVIESGEISYDGFEEVWWRLGATQSLRVLVLSLAKPVSLIGLSMNCA
jgi:hypothetical protein